MIYIKGRTRLLGERYYTRLFWGMDPCLEASSIWPDAHTRAGAHRGSNLFGLCMHSPKVWRCIGIGSSKRRLRRLLVSIPPQQRQHRYQLGRRQ